MAVYSMTGYASAQHDTGPWRLGLEIRSVNGRFLDLSLRLSDELRGFEPLLREQVQAHLKRGKVELRAFVESSAAALIPEPSARLLQRLGALQDGIRSWVPDARALGVADILRLATAEQGGGQDWGPTLQTLAPQVLQELLAARAREGARLAAMLLERVAQLRALAQTAEPLVPQLVEQQRLRFLERWREAMALAGDAAPPQTAQERALSEAAAYALRIDVAEELTRLRAHLDEIERLLRQGGEVGKRLDFLIQELHREANTLGSKSATLELTRIAVDMKVLIEQMREQVQNLE
ncbi:MAG: YicC/YloC family endoribonuclease [Hylemonella sp.]